MHRQAYAHDAVVTMRRDDPAALGGAITAALCGGWDHQPPCPWAPHLVTNTVDGENVAVRVVFATEPDDEQRVRGLIRVALAAGTLTVPTGGVAHWELLSEGTGRIRADEGPLADRLTAG